ncbi:ABC transporter substrate-binding protein [Pantoea sp. ACRSB]|uniref:ABC transporter substrate-binding protein n=1 Tax=Pantoea sp. ACRSB TaxID=2918207 RepID=UPI00289325C1|nr:ABC transporter substrate-binding protein [Pantoea sp. ACRSB]MCG7389637.1 ABC transporter substrate-binding protein [Pantoea sp. ACRSB]
MKKVMLMLVALLMAAAAPAQAAQKVRLLLDWFVNPNHAAIFAAKESGAFARQGLDVEMIAPADSASVPLLLAAGKADLAVSYQPQLYTLVDKGVPVIRVGTLIGQPLNTLTTLKSSNIKTLRDFEGKTLGYAIPGFEDVAIQTMLKSAGLDIDKVKLINLNMDAASALLSHKIDGAMTIYRNYELLELRQQGAETLTFKPEEHGVPAYDELIVLANAGTAATDPRIGKFLHGLNEGVAYLRAHPEAVWQAFIKAYPELNTPLNHQAWQATLPLFASDAGRFDEARYQAFAHYMLDNKLIDQVAPLSRYSLPTQ